MEGDFNVPPTTLAPPSAPADGFDPMAYIAGAAPTTPAVHQPGVVDLRPTAPAASPTAPAAPAAQPQPWWAASQAPAPQAPPPPQAPSAPVPSYMQTQAPQATPWFDPAAVNDYGLNAEQKARFSGSLSVIEQVVNHKLAAMEAVTRQQMESKFGAVAQDNDMFFATQIDAQIPDLAILTQDPAWAAYLNARVPMTGQPMQSLITNALANRDMRTLKEITDGFRSTRQAAPQAPATVPVNSGYYNVAPQTAPQAQVLPMSAHTRATQDFVMKRISKAQFDQVDAVYRQAVNEGRVDYNA